MIYDWYKIFNTAEFEALDLVSRTVTLDLEDLGPKEVLITIGNYTSITYDGVMLPVQMSAKNPFEFESRAVYLNTETNDVYLGLNGREA